MKFGLVNFNGITTFLYRNALFFVYKVLVSGDIYKCVVLYQMEYSCKSNDI